MDLETCLDSLYASNDEEEVEDSDDGKGVAALAYNPPAALPACLDPKLFRHQSPIINDPASHYALKFVVDTIDARPKLSLEAISLYSSSSTVSKSYLKAWRGIILRRIRAASFI